LDGSGNSRGINHVAIVTNAHGRFQVPIDAFHVVQKSVDEMIAELLAFTNNINACIFLLFEPDKGRVRVSARKIIPLKLPRRL
jgi:hypothetical protein